MTPPKPIRWEWAMLAAAAWLASPTMAAAQPAATLVRRTPAEAAACIVKLYGAGGLGRIEGYGTGVMVSPRGHILTAWTPLADAGAPRAVLADGRRRSAQVLAVDRGKELAMLKVEADGLPCFQIPADLREADAGDTVYALSNAFNIAAGDEPATVQRGVVAAVAPIDLRAGYRTAALGADSVLVLDMGSNNPGAAGGAVVDGRGRLVGLIGKELKNTKTDTWVHYALPPRHFQEFAATVIATGRWTKADALAARPAPAADLRADLRGLAMLPDVLDRTPAFVDGVEADSPADKAGLRPDDLIVSVDDMLVQSVEELRARFAQARPEQTLRLGVERGGELLDVALPPRPPKPKAAPAAAGGKP